MPRLLIGLTTFLGLTLAVSLPPLGRAADEKSDDDKWVQLFNGKNLDGWKTHPDDKARWSVKDGNLVGEGPVGHLYSERDDYENFVYRIEAKISDKGNSGQYFRSKFAKGFPPAYEAQINSTHGDPQRTGSLYNFAKVTDMLVPPDTWFSQEVTAVGNHIIIKVNDKVVVNFIDPKNTHTKGHFAIQQHNDGSVITVRKIEVIELPATK